MYEQHWGCCLAKSPLRRTQKLAVSVAILVGLLQKHDGEIKESSLLVSSSLVIYRFSSRTSPRALLVAIISAGKGPSTFLSLQYFSSLWRSSFQATPWEKVQVVVATLGRWWVGNAWIRHRIWISIDSNRCRLTRSNSIRFQLWLYPKSNMIDLCTYPYVFI